MTERQNMRELARKAKQRMITGYYGKGEQRGRRRTLEDKVMHDKIVAIVEQDGTVTDVIARLVDGEAYAAAGEVERQRLVLNAAATYRRVKEEIAQKGRIAAEV